ncbi:46423_t:CDS:2, partial [Gigaspora margarita]
MAENSNTLSFNPINTSIQKSSGKPKSIVWGMHIKQENQISKGSPAVLEDHLGNLCNKAPLDSQLSNFVESTKLTQDRIKDINRALLKTFIVCGIPFYIIENPFFVELLKTLHPAYEPPSKDVLSGCYLVQETAFVNQAIIKQLTDSKNLTI